MPHRIRRPGMDVRTGPQAQRRPQRTLEPSLARARGGSIIAVLAGAGYGKSLLLDRLARTQQKGYALLSITPDDAAPGRFLTRLVSALRPRIRPDISAALPDAASIETPLALDAIIAALRPVRLALMLDDVHDLAGEGLAAVSALLSASLPQATFFLAGRSMPAELQLPKHAVLGRVTWVSANDLDIDPKEFAAALPAHRRLEGQSLYELTGGWPAALGALSAQPEDVPTSRITEILRDYVDSEVIRRLPPEVLDLLSDAAVTGAQTVHELDRVRGTADSASTLTQLRRNPIPLADIDDDSIRIRPLLSQQLETRLRRSNPTRLGELTQRLGELLTASGRFDEGFEQIRSRCDEGTLVNFVYWQGVALTVRGKQDVVKRWLSTFSSEALHTYPNLVVLHSFVCTLDGQVDWLKPWLAILKTFERQGAAPWSAGDPNVRHLLSELSGIDSIGAGAEAALAAHSPWVLLGRLLIATREVGDGRLAEAEGQLAALLPMVKGLPMFAGWALALLGVIHALNDRWEQGYRLLEAATDEGLSLDLLNSRWSFLFDAVRAAFTSHFGDQAGARLLVLKAERRLDSLSVGPRVVRLAALVMMCRAAADLDEPALVQRLRLKGAPYARESPFLAAMLGNAAPKKPGQGSLLTDAQLRVLHMLNGPLTVPRIAAEMGLSPATVRTHIRSIFQRLGTNNRADAVKRAEQLALL